jgi:hypothetical protein
MNKMVNGVLVPLTQAEISQREADIAQAEAEQLATGYIQERREAYPSLEEQADMAYWDRQNGTTTLDDAITAVKLSIPKPTGE